MAEAQRKTQKKPQTTKAKNKSSYSVVLEKLNSIAANYANLPMDSIYSAFSRAASGYWENFTPIQRNRILQINPLPYDFTKEQLNEFLKYPQNSDYELQQIGEGLRWSNYSWQKLIKSYADMLQFHTIVTPKYVTKEDIKSENFKREYRLVEKLISVMRPKEIGRKIAMQAGTQGKVFYVPRFEIDKSHNKVSYFFLQELPKSACTLIGFNNISGWTVSFNLCYFLQVGTDYRQFGSLFEPYMDSFAEWYSTPENERKISKRGEKFVYATKNNERIEGNRRMWVQNGTAFYYVSLPIDRVWTFEVDSSTGIVASPFTGLMQTLSQQSNFEAAQLSNIINPLIKIFTGEIPYTKAENSTQEDGFRLSLGGRALFEQFWENLTAAHNTDGTAFFTAPVENIKSHDFNAAANSNEISRSYLIYSGAKAGTNGLIPVDDRPNEETVKNSAKLEAQFEKQIYRTFERMTDCIIESLNLKYEWAVQYWGDIYSDDQVRANALKQIDKGDLYSWQVICSQDGISIFDRLAVSETIKESGFTELLMPPQTSYTQSTKSQSKSDTGGAPNKDQMQVEETKIEKQVEVTEE